MATNLLESMVTNKLPTVAEANDIANSLDKGSTLVLAAETAIGVDPVGAVDVVLRALRAFEGANGSHVLADGPRAWPPSARPRRGHRRVLEPAGNGS